MIGNVNYPYLILNYPRQIFKTLLIASEMYLKELVALSLSFPHFRVNILTVNSQYKLRDEKCSRIVKAIKLHL